MQEETLGRKEAKISRNKCVISLIKEIGKEERQERRNKGIKKAREK